MSTTTEPTLLDKLREQRLSQVDTWADLIHARELERGKFHERSQTDEFKALSQEQRDQEIETFRTGEAAFKANSDQREAEILELDERIRQQEDVVRRRAEGAAASAETERGGLPGLLRRMRVSITNEPLTYRSDNTRGDEGLSYYRDLALVHGPGISLQTGGTRDQAQARLIRHGQEMDKVMPARAKEQEKRAERQIAEAETEFLSRMNLRMQDPKVDRLLREMRDNGLLFSPFERRVTPNSTDGYGGYFIPPVWLIDEYIPGLRAHLVVAGLPRQMDVPAGTNSINVPKLSTLTTVGYQQANNAGLPSQDWTDTAVSANVKTIGGYSDVAIQLLEQSPHGIVDEVITTDLMAAYNKFLDGEVIAGDGTNAATLNGGHLQGIYNGSGGSAWSGVNTVTFTASNPAPYQHAALFGAMASQIARTRYDAENFRIAVHGRRWFFYATGLDSNDRPLGETTNGGRYNVQAALENGLQAEGLVGTLPYLNDAPVYIDDNITTSDTTGSGSGQDIALAGLWDDAWLFKSPLRTDVFREVESATLGVRFRLYNYAAFMLRYGQSFAVASGTGFSSPQVSGLTSLVF